jgi:hypothetical protein
MSLRDLIFSQQSTASIQDKNNDSLDLGIYGHSQSFWDEPQNDRVETEPSSILLTRRKSSKQAKPRFSFDNNQYYENIIHPVSDRENEEESEDNDEEDLIKNSQ